MVFDKLSRLEQKRERIATAFIKDIRAAKSGSERESIECDERFELEMIDDEIQTEKSRRLLVKARKLDIPVPSGNGVWVTSQIGRATYLREDVRFDLAKTIRGDQKERVDLRKNQILLYTSILAIASSIISILVSLFRK